MTLFDRGIDHRRLEVWIDHFGAADIGLTTTEVEHMTEVVQRDDARRRFTVSRRQEVVRMLGFGIHQP
jgi:hypothetical protein